MKGFSSGCWALGLGLFIASFFIPLFQPDLISAFLEAHEVEEDEEKEEEDDEEEGMEAGEGTVKTNDQKKEKTPTCDNN